eukprot:919883-Amphidinium_carterae.1
MDSLDSKGKRCTRLVARVDCKARLILTQTGFLKAPQLQLLGVELTKVFITPGRTKQRLEEVQTVLRRGRWTKAEAAKLVGRLTFFRSFAAAKQIVPAMHALQMRSVEEEGRTVLTDDERFVECARPIVVKEVSESKPVAMYTDGAVEGEHFGYAAVLAVPGCRLRVTSGTVPTIAQVAQIELFPVLVANHLEGKDSVILFTDNESVKEALAKFFR